MAERSGDDGVSGLVVGRVALRPQLRDECPARLLGRPPRLQISADIEWDARALSGAMARGPRELALMWADWVEAWESYVYRVIEYRDLGDWVLLVGDVRARGRQGIAVEMRTFEVYRVREGKLARLRVFPSEGAALKAVGLPG